MSPYFAGLVFLKKALALRLAVCQTRPASLRTAARVSRFSETCLHLVLLIFSLQWGNQTASAQSKHLPDMQANRKLEIKVSRETTWLTEPVAPDGTIDYHAAATQMMSAGVTPENNACPLILQAIGPRPEGERLSDQYFEMLGLEPLPEKGDYFQDLDQWLMVNSPETIKSNQSYGLETSQRPWSEEEFPLVAAWLRDNEKPLHLFSSAAQKSRYYFPIDAYGREPMLLPTRLPIITQARKCEEAFIARAMLRLGQGKYSEAWSDLVTLHRIGRLFSRSMFLIEGLVGQALQAEAIRGELMFLSSTALKREELIDYLRLLEQLPANHGLKASINLERIAILQALTTCSQSKAFLMELIDDTIFPNGEQSRIGLSQFVGSQIDWNRALRCANLFFDQMLFAAEIPDFKQREHAFRLVNQSSGKPSSDGVYATIFSLNGDPEAMTTLLTNMFTLSWFSGYSAASHAIERTDVKMNLLRLAFELAIYFEDHGSYPDTLESLKSPRLPAIPEDSFAGKPLKYQPTKDGYLLYSVGDNGIDDGGRGEEDNPSGDDLVVRMSAPIR